MQHDNELIEDACDLLEYAKSLGMKEVSADNSVIASMTSDTPKEFKNVKTLEELSAKLDNCARCKLHSDRNNIVFGEGNPNADLMFIGEAPGRDEDKQGIPFVGRAGQLLNKMIKAMGYERNEVYIGNIVKCRPPNNRNPEPDEVSACIPFLIHQCKLISPKCIVCLGSVATQNLLQTDSKISSMRGKFTEWQGIPVMPTYHPAFLLRNASMKAPVWSDMQMVMKLLKKDKK